MSNISSLLSSFSNLNKGKPGALPLCKAAFLKLDNLNDILQPFEKQKKINLSVNVCITRVMSSYYTVSNSLVDPTKESQKKRLIYSLNLRLLTSYNLTWQFNLTYSEVIVKRILFSVLI